MHTPQTIDIEPGMEDTLVSTNDIKGEFRSGRSQTPQFLREIQQLDDPLNRPLINTSNSIAYSLSNSIIDPFSNLIRHLHISHETSKVFHQIAQNLATNTPATNFIPILFQLIDEKNGNVQCRLLALQSLRVLSINDEQFCKEVLNYDKFNSILVYLKDPQFMIEILQLLTTICQYADESKAERIKNSLDSITQETREQIEEHVVALYAILSKYATIFSDDNVKKIKKHINYPGKPPLNAAIVWSCLECIDNFLACPSSGAYNALKNDKDTLLGKLAHAIICVEKNEDPNLLMMIMKVLLESIDEFNMDDIADTLKEFRLQLVSRLINMQNCDDPALKQMAETVLKRLNLIKNNSE
ncbi:hypothetical protein TVAG_068820 [Trichomonas vaginalis G3]|uniref:Uncharacterized protein n=1 Tax=Trichomonas vaginalis (strain ATCC PRA-98 / G3) TaxID=412133 RepID=A2EZK8_TRIV3|nr:armadillo (ARM) repeat-containing protein family [Trichomonas vaginalis G3]EAY01916.1 hypothetical protein TVAG_068820 [Trichomonas vaginalis G3]KAI5485286.1 armadillo (ARM) repeat-containing protein family [Trichomonas vaginalis G3]|eukprot:XP_001314455.1 hypothetical protein [Trichomonas vaginalis G3]